MSVYIYGNHAMEHALANPKRKIHRKTDKFIETEPLISDLKSLHGPVLVLDQVQEIRNIGAIIRSAAAFGVKFVIVSVGRNCPNIFEKDNYGVLAHTASGALEYVNLVSVGNINHILGQLKDKGYWVAALDEGGIKLEKQFDKICLIVGQEGRGLRDLVKKQCDVIYKIPTTDQFGCLNASVAASIGMYTLMSK